MEQRTPNPSNHLLYWRKRKDVSLSKLAARIEVAGHHYVSKNTLNRWEKGETSMPAWAAAELAEALKITEQDILYGPRDGDPATPVNLSGAYTGLDLEIAEHVISMGYTSWLASRLDDARKAAESILPWLEASQRRAPRSTRRHQGLHLLARGYELLGALALDRLENDAAISRFRQALTISEELHDDTLITAHTTELGDAFRRKGDKETAIALMELALSRSQRTERATRGYVLEMLAYTYADAGNEAAFTQHIELATDLERLTKPGLGLVHRLPDLYGEVATVHNIRASRAQIHDVIVPDRQRGGYTEGSDLRGCGPRIRMNCWCRHDRRERQLCNRHWQNPRAARELHALHHYGMRRERTEHLQRERDRRRAVAVVIGARPPSDTERLSPVLLRSWGRAVQQDTIESPSQFRKDCWGNAATRRERTRRH
jgi:transcriptional regulator with XRE-family HTH domain